MVEYRADPEAAARFLPTELSLGRDPGAAAAVFSEWQWCSESGAELIDPSRCQFTEFQILLGCEYEGRPMARCPYAWVDQPVPMMRGWIQGMPKQFGTIALTRTQRVGQAGPRLTCGQRFAAVASSFGRRMTEAIVTITGRSDASPFLFTVPLVHTRLFPAWVPSDEPSSTLVTSEVTGVEFSEVMAGEADLLWLSGIDPDLDTLAPLDIGAGYVFSYAETLRGGSRLADRD